MIVESAAAFLPADRSLASLREAATSCRGCELYKNATQTVFGSGPQSARVLLVGEQPGDREDIEGAPFVGPAGGVLDRAIEDLGLVRGDIYVTNAVKHFKWTPKGKRRIHQTPRASEVRACRPWLEAEVDAIRPDLVVCLGATAVASVLGPDVRVLRDRGKVIESEFGACLVTIHPSALLRVDGEAEREAGYKAFLSDLRRGLDYLGNLPSRSAG